MKNRYRIASRNPKSPMRVTRNAFFAAAAADGLCVQNPISRYEPNPTSSHITNSWMMFPAITSPIIAAENSDIYAKYRTYPGSPFMYPWEYTCTIRLTDVTTTSIIAVSESTINPK